MSVTAGRTDEATKGSFGGLYAAAGLSFGAALLHLWMVPDHFLAWWGYGVFFAAVALFQGLVAVLLLRSPTRLVVFAGISVNILVVGEYILTRTRGVPAGPHAGRLEGAGLLDIAATLVEVGAVVLLVAMLEGGDRRRTINVLLLAGTALWFLRFAGVVAR